ncbi:hypothetical protein MML48_2g00005629 [Holotrichia oblita]|uniref:Uncharacterized protein n=1 Tax=Holotrichia oblita TaxID=644536 RepID=A0ACB9TM13_HOLOL|nr:hypothetical protein MML48_2g00005629 [Holotrichia oblita]
MMKKAKSFNVGDKVFAKVKGYPAWPAKIIADNGKKYEVSFYGTKETNLKRKDYQEAVEQIEAEIKDIGTDGNDEDMETEASTVGDTVDKKGKKRKRESLGEEAQTNKIQKTPSEEFNESQVTDQEEKTEEKTLTEGETVTRSGRIVKIKKFSDDEDEDNKKITKGKKLADQSSSHSETTDETTVESLKVEEVAQDTDTEEEGANENHAVTTKSKTDETVSPTKDIVEESSPLPQKEEFVDVNIVSIGYLETVIAYVTKLPNKLISGIKYNRTTPICDNEYEQAIEEAQEAKRVLAIKDKLENGSITVESEKNNVIINIKTDEDNLQQKHETQVLERKKTKLKYLKIEANLVDYDCKIKSCLGLDKADPKKPMKTPLIVDVMKRLRRYIGNVKEWNLAGDSLETFEADAEKIRQKAEEVFMKFVVITDQEEKTEEKTLTEGETVTRSGRIVKIKKFSDDEDEDNKKITKGKKLADQSSSHSETTDETTVESLKVEEVAQDTDTEEEGANENHAVTTKSKTDETVSPTKDIVEESSPLPQKEEFVDVNIVSIGYLETVIAYVKRETEPRESLENEVVIAKLPNKLIGIKYNRTTPICDNEYEQAIEEAQEAKRVLAIKDKLENGSITVERLDKADPKKAYEYMDLMMELDINSLMLKKHPLIVDVMKRLRRYIGNVKEWNLAGDSLETFEADAEKIRQKAEEVFMKFVSLFNVTDASAFWDVFNGEVDKFEEETKDLSESEMFSLCAEPNSRQAFFDSFEDKKEAEKIDKEKNIVEDIETVCST